MVTSSNFTIRRVAVLGAGVMGAQIAARMLEANIPVLLYDLAQKNGSNHQLSEQALQRLQKLKPPPLAQRQHANLITACNYDDDAVLLNTCDLIIEAIGERIEWKQALYQTVAPHIAAHALFVTNTSGLSINLLAESLPEKLRSRFCGVHFFNPPRYMKLVELIPTAMTDKQHLANLESFLVTRLGKGVVHAKDKPNFIANRIGVFSMLATIYHAAQFNLGFDVVDNLTGPLLGRPKSATFRTADVVGLDTFAHVVATMKTYLPDDPFAAYYQLPDWFNQLVANGALGQKTGAGIYKKHGKTISVFDLSTGQYRLADQKANAAVVELMKIKNPKERLSQLQQSSLAEAQFVWSILRDTMHYAAYHLADIADTVRDVDLAIRWGFGWRYGPFETWQMADWQAVSDLIRDDIAAGKAMAKVALPAWVGECEAGVYQASKAYSPDANTFKARSNLAVYQRQYFPESVLAEQFDEGETVYQDDAIRLWHRGDKVLIASFKTKMNTISKQVLLGIQQAVKTAENKYQGLVLWQRHGEHFSVGADLSQAVQALTSGREAEFMDMVTTFQDTSQLIRYSQVPVVAAVNGYVFGGGCELMLHCARTVAAFETYIGLVEAGVGLLPAGGGLKEFARRASELATSYGGNVFDYLKQPFEMIAKAEVAGGALDAKDRHYLTDNDIIMANRDELLFIACEQVKNLSINDYRPPLPRPIKVAGKTGIATLQTLLVNYRDGGFISSHDYVIASKIAEVICGGAIEAGCMVDEDWLLKLERDAFLALALTKKTQARISHTLKTGKPLRN